jgi:ribosomal protein S18 acetylase RimI-like enzyme
MPIRPATPQDDAAIWRVLAPALRAGETYPVRRDVSEVEALAYFRASQNEVFVAEENGEIVGTYYIRPNTGGGGAHVANCGYVVAPEATGRGIARAMCLHSIERARERGFRAMQFNFVIATNEAALHLWKSCGFDIVGRLPGAFEHPTLGFVDAFVMYRTV